MTDTPEHIWVTKDEDDESAQTLGDLYAQHFREGMTGNPTQYIRQDVSDRAIEEAVKAERERCALIIEWHVEALHTRTSERFLIPRTSGDNVAIAYAAAIREGK